MKKTLDLFIFQLKLHYKYILIWGIILASIMCLYMSFFATMQELAQAKFDMMPTEYLQLLGMDNLSDMGNYNNYFSVIFNLLIIVISLFASTFAVNIIRNEEKNNTIEFLYSLSLTRSQIYIAKLLLVLLAVVFVVILTGSSGIMMGYLVANDTFVSSSLFKVMTISTIIPILFMSVMYLFTSISSKYSSGPIACGIVMFSYMLGYLGKLLEDKGKWLLYCSPFETLSPSKILSDNISNSAIIICILIIIISLVIGYISYNKRDYNL